MVRLVIDPDQHQAGGGRGWPGLRAVAGRKDSGYLPRIDCTASDLNERANYVPDHVI